MVQPFPLIVMEAPAMTQRDASVFIHDVLQYFETLERAATLRNNRALTLHYQHCWLEVCEAYYGADSLPAREILRGTTAVVGPTAGSRPRWFIEKYSRPLLPVVGRVSRRLDSGESGAGVVIHYDLLSCGHQVEVFDIGPDHKPAKHRRCKKCVNALPLRMEVHSDTTPRVS